MTGIPCQTLLVLNALNDLVEWCDERFEAALVSDEALRPAPTALYSQVTQAVQNIIVSDPALAS